MNETPIPLFHGSRIFQSHIIFALRRFHVIPLQNLSSKGLQTLYITDQFALMCFDVRQIDKQLH